MTTLILGAGGFIGSAVMRQIASGTGDDVVGFVRSHSAARKLTDAGMAAAVGDINDDISLRAAMHQASTVISCVSYVGSDEQQCIRVNQHGMRNVASVAAAIGAQRLLYVSTAAVYGPGPFRDLPVDGVPLNPISSASRTRAIAEQHIRDAGGVVVRPHLVYGQGDLWFIPTLTSITDRLGALIDCGTALLSTIDVDDLARGIVSLAQRSEIVAGSTVHLNAPAPSRVIDILARQSSGTGWTMPTRSIDRARALHRATQLGIDQRHIDMISLDHWFRNGTV
ncbi:NAD-dependent epimerase/dehydratase family protein [Rhodococcus sp. G-MC3]|uniref:NAD-dependent epimerase/dehydratase family protein n=1 Tax=Rhodococcus sp. G-MC3 TaxID=3046209 RepID=UPI0024B9181B|nr:NAD-dependent epimerase/dehydratase family protein [Rhodococcus sp. G-MC3]MDJ0396701.1 NAD-dependent epimerase/dehydratase family protein [Rhodococcus sp. G-MC3]